MAATELAEFDSMSLRDLRNRTISSMKLVKKKEIDNLVDFIYYIPLTQDFILGYNFTAYVYDGHSLSLKK